MPDLIRPDLLTTAASHLGMSEKAVLGEAERLLSSLRAAIYAPAPLKGEYRPATEGGRSGWENLVPDGDYAPILAARRRWEAAHGLILGGKRPVSGAGVLLGEDGALTTFLDGYGADPALKYGPYIHILTPEATARPRFYLGDSHNLAMLGRLAPLTPAEATLFLATQGAILPDLDAVEYIEGLTLGGVDMGRDLEQVI